MSRTLRVEFVGSYTSQSVKDMVAVLSKKPADKLYDYLTDNDNIKAGDFVLVQTKRTTPRYGDQTEQAYLAVAYVRETFDERTQQARERIVARLDADELLAEERRKVELAAIDKRLKELDKQEELTSRYTRLKERLSPEEQQQFEHALGLTTKH